MTRLTLLVLGAASVLGLAGGWLAYALTSEDPAEEAPPGAAAPTSTQLSHRFPLLPADMRQERETAAVAADARGRVLLAWASQTGADERTLFVARSEDGGQTFAEPTPFRKVPVFRYKSTMRGKEVTRSTTVGPRLTAAGNTIYLAWMEAVGPARGDFLVARTEDGGRTFAEPVRAHGADAGRPAFTGLGVGPDGAAVCCWLGRRGKGQHPFCSVALPGGEEFQAEQQVNAGQSSHGVCPCCDTNALRSAEGDTFVAFRDNDSDYRDICVARVHGTGSFETPVRVNEERWRFEGCPHDGPSLALGGDRLHVAWMDAHSGKRRVYHAASGLDKLQFTPRALDTHGLGEQGHPRLAAADGSLYAVWDGSLSDEPAPDAAGTHQGHHHGQVLGGGRAIFHARSDDGESFGAARALAPRSGTLQVNPAVAVGPGGVVCVVWSELTAVGKSMVFVRIPTRQE